MIYIKIVFLCLIICSSTRALVPRPHPCNRPCQANDTKTCEYQFTVENYLTLSKACYHCPWNSTDCFRPHCISTNGGRRPVLAINRQIPGPSIEVCKGDTVQVWVENKMEDGSSVTIHWHGVTQNYTNFMDGVPGLTQCNIPPYETFRYEFDANNSGTHWYHSHTGFQFGDGLHGPFIVREPADVNRHYSLYDVDNGAHVMMLTDWEDQMQITRYLEEMHDVWSWPVKHISVTVNGRGQVHEVVDIYNITKSGDTVPTYTPYEVFTVSRNERYRFRMISAATRCFFKVMIDDHQLTVISTDGEPIKPVQAGAVNIHPGERLDFVLNAAQEANDYWIKILGLGNCGPAGGFHAILHYDGYQGNPDMVPSGDKNNFTREDMVLSPHPDDVSIANRFLESQLRYEPVAEDMNYTQERVDVIKYITLQYLDNDNSIYNREDLYPASSRLGMITPTMNNITMKLPPVPLSTQWYDMQQKDFCNADTLDTANDCNDNLCHCYHMYTFELGQVVELFLIGFANDPHPMHLHGYSVRVVGTGVISTEKDAFKSMYVQDIIRRDANGEFNRTLINPWRKDTVTVQGRGGYAILRFKADNPGMWFFHCHTEGHMMQGMAMVIKVGNPSQFPRPPFFVPKCGGYQYQPTNQCESDTSSASSAISSIWMILITLAFAISFAESRSL